MLGPGIAAAYLGMIVILPVAALVVASLGGGIDGVHHSHHAAGQRRRADADPVRGAASSSSIDAVMGTLIAWILVRDDFPGKRSVNALIDLPFALPTIVAGLMLLTLYGPKSPFGLNLAYTQVAIVLALLFVTLPFVVRSVQPVLLELDADMEEAAASLGASPLVILRRIVLPDAAARDPDRCRPCLRPCNRRVRLDRPHLGQHPLQDPDRIGRDLQPDRERRPDRGCRFERRSAGHLARRAGRDGPRPPPPTA